MIISAPLVQRNFLWALTCLPAIVQSHERLTCLDKLIAEFGGGSSGASHPNLASCTAILEHLQAARRYLLGAALDEYRLSLDHAKSSLFSIADGKTRTEVRNTLVSLA